MLSLAERLRAGGYRTIVPRLRGFGPTRFRFDDTIRHGRGVTLASDAIALLDGLGVEHCLPIGPDWGGRTAYNLAALVPDRLGAIVTLGIGWSPRGKFEVPGFEQARLRWYQWLMTIDGGAARVRDDPVGFAHAQWDHWSPIGWFSESEFDRTAESFRNPDWPAITPQGYRSRWRDERVDERYAAAQATIERIGALLVPCLMIVGGEDRADYPEGSAETEACFPSGCRRIVLKGVGHFPAREAPEDVMAAISGFLSEVVSARSSQRCSAIMIRVAVNRCMEERSPPCRSTPFSTT